jgi:hypothetical protein
MILCPALGTNDTMEMEEGKDGGLDTQPRNLNHTTAKELGILSFPVCDT